MLIRKNDLEVLTAGEPGGDHLDQVARVGISLRGCAYLCSLINDISHGLMDSPMVGKEWRQENEVLGYIVSTVRKDRGDQKCSTHFLLLTPSKTPAYGMVLPRVGKSFHFR